MLKQGFKLYGRGDFVPYEYPPSELLTNRSITACFTGHRPKNIPLDLSDPYNRDSLIDAIYQRTCIAYDLGYRIFITGMAEGIDAYAAFAVGKLKEDHDDVRLVAAIPFRERIDIIRRNRFLNRAYNLCDETIIVSENFHNGVFHIRDRYMVDNSSMIIAAVGKVEGGTGYTLQYAIKQSLNADILSLNTICQKIISERI